MNTTLRMTRVDTSALGSEGKMQVCKNWETTEEEVKKNCKKVYLLFLTITASEGKKYHETLHLHYINWVTSH